MRTPHNPPKLLWSCVITLLAGLLLSIVSFSYLLASGRVGSNGSRAETIAGAVFVSGLILFIASLTGLILMAYHPIGKNPSDQCP